MGVIRTDLCLDYIAKILGLILNTTKDISNKIPFVEVLSTVYSLHIAIHRNSDVKSVSFWFGTCVNIFTEKMIKKGVVYFYGMHLKIAIKSFWGSLRSRKSDSVNYIFSFRLW